jgi:hypothetical protein
MAGPEYLCSPVGHPAGDFCWLGYLSSLKSCASLGTRVDGYPCLRLFAIQGSAIRLLPNQGFNRQDLASVQQSLRFSLLFIYFVEVVPMQQGSKRLGLQFGVVRLCAGAVL